MVGTLIPDEAGLDACLDDLAGARRVALDTEFHAEGRYLPELMLIQLATEQGVWLIDPRATDPSPVLRLISTAELIVHGGIQDLRLLAELGLSPERVFDTQRAAGLLGIHYPERLSVLCHRLLDAELDKSATLTRWDNRPLTTRQRQYAAEDARQLLPLAARLEAELAAQGRLSWAWELGEELQQEVVDYDDTDLLEEWEISSRMSELELRCLLALHEWRCQQALIRNKPTHYILPNAILLDLARRQPTSIRSLSANRRMHTGTIKRHGSDLLRCIAEAPPLSRRPPTRQQRQLARLLSLWAELTGEAHRIAPGLLLPSPFRVVHSGGAALTGWREPFREPLEKFLSGQEAIQVGDDDQKIKLKPSD